jgi:uncharacterized protein YprB with RNaseH-like and TPR domain
MSGLKERLLRLKRPDNGVAGRNGAESSAGSGEEREEARRAEEREAAQEQWERLGGVRLERNASGAFLLRERVYAGDHRHGRATLGELRELAGELGALASEAAARTCGKRGRRTAAASAPAPAPELERLLFFDTETTGLGVGAGNVPFMIGLGFYEADRFVVQQLFIRNPAEETAMLAYLEGLLERFTHIVSYNGRSFDWPILQSRFVLARRKPGKGEWQHIDLLYPARSLWKTSLPSCRLSAVEADKLGFRRVHDVPGSMAPVLYVQYLAERDPGVIAGVFVHNEHDIVSLAALAIHLAKLLRGEEPAGGLGDEELLRLSAWLDKLGKDELAERMRARLGLRLLDGGVRAGRERLLLELAAAYKKRGRYDRAAELWRRFVAERGGSFACPVEPYIELAMYGEHRERRYGEALAYAEEALNQVWKRMSLTRVDGKQRELVEALQKRIRRLRDKQRREAAAARAGTARRVADECGSADDGEAPAERAGTTAYDGGTSAVRAGARRTTDARGSATAANRAGEYVPRAAAAWIKTPRPKKPKPVYAMESLI